MTANLQANQTTCQQVEYKEILHPVEGGLTVQEVAKAVASNYEELSNFRIIVKESNSNIFVLEPKVGGKG